MVLPCVFWSDVGCSFRKTLHVGVLPECYECAEFDRFLDAMNEQDEKLHAEYVSEFGRKRERIVISKEELIVQNRGFTHRLSLNSDLLRNKYWVLPVNDARHKNYSPVGRGAPTNSYCGSFRRSVHCFEVDNHVGKVVGGVDCTGKVVSVLQHYWCQKSDCCVCFARGWAVREARHIVDRLDTAVKRGLGKIEHVTIAFSQKDWDFEENVLRVKAHSILINRGVVGGCTIFHGFRIDKEIDMLVWRPHYHCLSVISGGFDRCRNCVHKRDDCGSCDGFKGREVRGFKEDGTLVKVHDERMSIFGTAWYQLNHSTLRFGFRRFHIVNWFGSMSKHMFKTVPSKFRCSCPACQSVMENAVFVGEDKVVKNVGSPAYRKVVFRDEFDASGNPNFVRGGA